MKDKFDVIIVGAGPAGLKCAEQFKNSNLSVLLVEKNKIIGPKTCAGGLTPLCSGFDLPESKIRTFNRLVIYFLDKKHKIKLVRPLRTIDRYDFGQYLLGKIKDCQNIRILKETTVTKIEGDRVITNKGDFYYKYLVGADGIFSIIRKYLGLDIKFAIGLCCKVPKITNEFAVYFYPKLLGGGYIWVFPHKNYTHIGVFSHPRLLNPQKAKKVLNDFLEKHSFIYDENKLEAAPVNFFYQGFSFGNIFLAGDAAGLVSGATGEGISYALISGQEIGRKILNPAYRTTELQKVLRIKKRQEKLGRILDTFGINSFLRELLFRIYLILIKRAWFQEYFGV